MSFPDRLHKLREQIIAFMRPWRGFGMVLHGKNWELFMLEAFDGMIVQIQMREFAIGGHRLPIDGKAVVLRGDFNLLRDQVLHRMIRAAVPELELIRIASERQRKQLMP